MDIDNEKILENKLLKLFEDKKIIQTGSRVWGLQVAGSDYDYFADVGSYHQIINFLKDQIVPYQESAYFRGICFKINSKDYNLIALRHNEIMSEYFAWDISTKIVKFLIDNELIKLTAYNKQKRVEIFHKLVNVFIFEGKNHIK